MKSIILALACIIMLAGCNASPTPSITTIPSTESTTSNSVITTNNQAISQPDFQLTDIKVTNISYNSVILTFSKNIDTGVYARLIKGESVIGIYPASGSLIYFMNLQPDTSYTAILYSDADPNYGKHIEFITGSKPIVYDPYSNYGYGGYYYYNPPIANPIKVWSGTFTITVQ